MSTMCFTACEWEWAGGRFSAGVEAIEGREFGTLAPEVCANIESGAPPEFL